MGRGRPRFLRRTWRRLPRPAPPPQPPAGRLHSASVASRDAAGEAGGGTGDITPEGSSAGGARLGRDGDGDVASPRRVLPTRGDRPLRSGGDRVRSSRSIFCEGFGVPVRRRAVRGRIAVVSAPEPPARRRTTLPIRSHTATGPGAGGGTRARSRSPVLLLGSPRRIVTPSPSTHSLRGVIPGSCAGTELRGNCPCSCAGTLAPGVCKRYARVIDGSQPRPKRGAKHLRLQRPRAPRRNSTLRVGPRREVS